MKRISVIILFFTTYLCLSQNSIHVTSGSIDRIEIENSKYVSNRNIDIWIPDNYSTDKKYNVLYFQDGQMLFDAESTWNKQAWEVDQTLGELLLTQKINDVIVVGIWNGGLNRHLDYVPQKPFESLTGAQQNVLFQSTRANGNPVFSSKNLNSDNYLKFIVTELKPIIDKKYSVYADFQHTFIGGSSMGGLIALYAICEYPKVFGGAICMSTHWPVIFSLDQNPFPTAFYNYLKTNLPSPKKHKIYFDYGTKTLDELYQTVQPEVDAIMKFKKFKPSQWTTIRFDGDDHSELSWRKRFHFPIEFVLGNKNKRN